MTKFEEIYRAYFTDVFLYIRSLSGDEQLAEEITSQTFFKAMESLNSFRGDCDIRVWLCQIGKNCYYSHLKKAGRTRTVQDTQLETLTRQEESPEETLARQEEAARIQNALHQLNDPYKEVFLWRVYAQMPFRQIGQLFGKSENWACVTYHRARAMIQKRLEESEYEP